MRGITRELYILLITILFAVVLIAGCKGGGGGDDDADADADADAEVPTCEFAGDGICDEPANCALGTDEEDCVAACASGENLHLFAAACAFRDPPEIPPDDGDPSGGTLHLTGWRDGTIVTPMGEALGRTIQRHYRLFVPPAYDPGRSTPVVIMMPGHRVSHYAVASYTDLARSADQNGFIFILAEQQWRQTGEARWAWWSDWDWETNTESNPDFQFVLGIIDRVSGEYNVDRRRIYLAGHSRGAAMAFIMAMEYPDVIAGACVQSGFTEFGYLDHRAQPPWTERRVPMVFMHGDRDPDVSVAYGDQMVERLRSLGWVDDVDLVYHRLDNVTHRWQHWLNQAWWDFLYARPLPEEG